MPRRRKKKKLPKPVQLMIPFPIAPAVAINHDLANAIAEGPVKMQKGMCWRNAIMSFLALAEELDEIAPIEYVEGWLIMHDGEYPIEHAWLEVNQEVVDVTLPGEQNARDYFAVYRYGVDEARKLICDYDGMLPLFGLTVAGDQGMRDAFEQLPVNKDQAIAWACLGYMKTGIKSLIVPEGVFFER